MWGFKSDWVANPRAPDNADLDAISNDIRNWGGNVDAGGYSLSNLGALTLTGNRLVVQANGNVGIGTANPLRDLHLSRTGGWPEFLLEAPDSAADFGRIWGISINQATRELNIRRGNPDYSIAHGVMTFKPNGVVKRWGTPVYADNVAATAGGLTAGDEYRTPTGVRMEVY
jgi:hypothetical protein